MICLKEIKTDKRIRYLIICILAICTTLLLSSCMTQEQKAEFERIEAQAEINSVKYISEKYNFEAKVLNTEAETVESSLFPSHDPTGYVTVTLMYEDKKFNVYINGDEESSEGKDNYQEELIREAIEQEAKSVLNIEAEAVCYEAVYNRPLMTSVYYDGDNLDEVLDDIDYTVDYKISTLNADLEKYTTEDMRMKLHECGEILIVNCADKSDFERIKEAKLSSFLMDKNEYVIYMKDYIWFQVNKTEYVAIEKKTYDGFTICWYNGSYCTVTESFCDSSEWVGHGFIEPPTQIFGAYEVESDAERVFFYVDIDKLNTNTYDNVGIATTSVIKGNTHYDNGNTSEYINDKYITKDIWMSDRTDVVFTVFQGE